MVTSNKDVKLRLSVETLGEEGVSKLRTAVLQLAKEGGEAAPEFQRLADEIDRLGAQGAALAQFQQLADQTAELAREQAAAAQRVDELGNRLAAARTNAAGFVASQQQATDALRAAQLSVVGVSGEIVKLKSQYDTAGRSTDEYRNALAGLVDRQTAAETAALQARHALADANKEYGNAERQLKAVELAYGRADKAARDVGDAFASSTSALRDAEQAAEALGVSTTDVAGAQAALTASFAQVAGEAQAVQYWLDAGTQALREQQAESQRAQQAHAEQLQSLNAEIRLRQQLATERAAAATATRAAAAAAEEEEQAQRAAAAAARAKADADQEMAEHNRLLAIQQAATNDLFRRSADALHQETAALREAAQAAALYEIAKEQQAAAERAAADEAEKAAARIATAFDKVGIQSVADLEREIQEVRAAMVTLRETAGLTGPAIDRAFAVGEQRIQALERDIREATGALTAADRAADLFRNSVGQIAAGNLVADAIGSMVERVKDLGREFISSIVALDQMRRGLNAVYKDTTVTANQIDFLRRTAGEAGVSFGALSSEFVKFSASMTTAGVPLRESNALFESLIKAGASLGLETEAIGGALNALSQMAAKGVVSMEELRQQLGDRLPGAFGLVAQGLGITQAELVKLVESGNLAARDLFPALTKSLQSLHGETDGLVPTWSRFASFLTLAAQSAGDQGAYEVLIGTLKLLGGTVAALVLGLNGLWTALTLAGSAALAMVQALRGDANALDFFREQVDRSVERLTAQANALNAFLVPQQQYAAGQQQAAQANATLNETVGQVLTRTQELTRAQQLAAVAVALNANTALDASAKYVQFSLAAAQLLKTQQEQTQASAKSAEAAKIEGQALVQIAQLRGEQAGILQAAAAAADKEAAALARVSASRNVELEILKQQRDQIEVNRVARNLSTEDVKVEVQAIEQKIIAAEGEAARSRETAEALRIEALQRAIAVQTYADNSARVDEYRAAVEAAARALELIETASRTGLATDEQVMAARERLAVAQRLYSDALGDSATKIERETAARSAGLVVQMAEYGARAQSAEIMARQARALGDTAQATYYELEAKRANIEITRIKYQLMRLEAEAEIQSLEIKKLEIPVNDALRQQKMQEIETRIQLQQVKLREAGAGQQVISALESELLALRNNQNVRDSGRGSIDSDTSSRIKNADAINKQTAALNAQDARKRTSDGLEASADGAAKGTFTSMLPLDIANQIVAKLRNNALTADDLSAAQSAMTQADNARQWMGAYQRSGGTVSVQGYQDMLSLYNGARGALERVQSLVQMRDAASSTKTAAGSDAAAATTTKTTNRTVTVRLQAANGNTSNIDGLSEVQAAAVIAALERARRTAA